MWREQFDPRFQISVNKSPVQFHRPDKNQPTWGAQLQSMGLDGSSIAVEITEGLLLDTNDDVAQQLHTLRAAGIAISLDDFGTGYSNLGYLKKFEVEYLKIDQSFVRRMEQNAEDLLIVKAIIQLSSSLGLETIAEGVETESAANILRALGCKMAQGYLWSRPLPAREIERFWCDWCLLEQT